MEFSEVIKSYNEAHMVLIKKIGSLENRIIKLENEIVGIKFSSFSQNKCQITWENCFEVANDNGLCSYHYNELNDISDLEEEIRESE